MNTNSHNRALTAIEIGVIIAVMSLIAVSIGMWLAAKRQEKRRMHFHTVTTALRAYRVDWNAFPPPLTEFREPGPTSRTVHIHYPDWTRDWTRALTTPVAYIAPKDGPDDPFARPPDRQYRYMSYRHIDRSGKVTSTYCILVGCGPDRDQDLPLDRLRLETGPGMYWDLDQKHGLPRPLGSYFYNPKKGKRSDGDIIEIVSQPSWIVRPTRRIRQ